MTQEKIKNLLLLEGLNIDVNDLEYRKYLEEKMIKAIMIQEKREMTEEEFVSAIKSMIPQFNEQYQRIKNNVKKMSQSLNSNFGISINFELIDLFEIANQCENEDDFKIEKNKYFEKLSLDSRFQGFDFIFYGLKNITLEKTINIQKQVLSSVDYITPEWMGKMRAIIDSNQPMFVNGQVNEKCFNFEYLDKIANFARKNNMKFRMHNIIWHKDFISIFENASKAEILHFLETYMFKINERYGDVLYAVDVLNEIASDIPNQVLRDSKWKDKLGEDYYIEVLKIAKKNFKDIPLFYNEYGEERKEKRNNILAIINKIKTIEQQENIILLDGIGIQSHYKIDTPDQDIKDAFLEYVDTGKILQITEFDVENKGYTSSFDYQTNRVYRTVLDCASTLGLNLINIWGVSQDISWKSGQINNFLSSDGNISPYSKKIIDTYSFKIKEQKDLSNVQGKTL